MDRSSTTNRPRPAATEEDSSLSADPQASEAVQDAVLEDAVLEDAVPEDAVPDAASESQTPESTSKPSKKRSTSRESVNHSDSEHASRAASAVAASPRVVAVIDIGVTSIRMAIAEIQPGRKIRTLDTLEQGADLGRNVFDDRKINRGSIEKAAEILKGYLRVLMEYGVDSQRDVRVFATTAVREAANSLAFTDRIYVATGLTVEILDAAEVNRMTYMAVVPQLRKDKTLADGKNVVVEVGGGTTEMLVIRSGNVLHSESVRLGALRSIRTLEKYRSGTSRGRKVLENHIRKTVTQMVAKVRSDASVNMVAIGGDIRFAARQICPSWDQRSLIKISVDDLDQLTSDILRLDVDEIVRRYDTNFVEAETIGPALVVHRILAEQFGLTHCYVSETNLREGLLLEITDGGQYTHDFRNQIVRAAIALGRRFSIDETHARNVAELAKSLFQQTIKLHRLDEKYETLLVVAALLYEIGLVISTQSNHKHALYLLRNSEIFGMSREDMLLIGLIARYHRRAYPQPSHDGFSTLNQEKRVVVAKLSAILRLAIALDDRRNGRIRNVDMQFDGGQVILTVPDVEDVSLEQIAMRENSGLFRDVFGMPVRLRGAS